MLPGELLPGLEQGAEVPVQKLHPVFLPHSLGGNPDGLVVLIGGDEQGGGKGVVPVFGGIPGGLLHPHPVAVGAPAVDVVRHIGNESAQVIGAADDELHPDLLGVLLQGALPGLILGIGVDIGVEPEPGDGEPLRPQQVDGPVGTGGTADVHQGIHRQVFHSSSNMVTWSPFRRA